MLTVAWCKIFWEAFNDLTLIILLICAFVSIVITMFFEDGKSASWLEGVGILFAVLISATVGATNDYKKELKFQELSKVEQKKRNVEVVREGKRISSNIYDVVVGDLVILRMGMEIVGDGILIEGDDIKVDESSMTGETNFVKKDILSRCMIERERIWEMNNKTVNERNVPTPILLSGTKVRLLLKTFC